MVASRGRSWTLFLTLRCYSHLFDSAGARTAGLQRIEDSFGTLVLAPGG